MCSVDHRNNLVLKPVVVTVASGFGSGGMDAAPASQFHRLLASFLIMEHSSITGGPVPMWYLENDLAQPRVHLLSLPMDSCKQSLLLKLAGGFYALNQEALTNTGSHQLSAPRSVLAPLGEYFFVFQALVCRNP